MSVEISQEDHRMVVPNTTYSYHTDNSTIYYFMDNTSFLYPNLSHLPFAPDEYESLSISTNSVPSLRPQFYSVEHAISTSIVLGLLILATIIGNVFVIAAVLLEKNLHNVGNYLIISLAVADLMVASLVMPLSAVSEISKIWFLQKEVCDMWTSFDVLCCTASILHLVAIAMDRYWAVTNIEYIRNRTQKRIIIMIVLVWTVAMFISIPPLFGWKEMQDEPDIPERCIISQDLGYTVFSTVGAFYLPMFIMMFIYLRIFMVARSRIRKEKFGKKKTPKTDSKDHTTVSLLSKLKDAKKHSSQESSPEKDVQQQQNNHVHEHQQQQQLPLVEGDGNLSTIKVKNGHVDEAHTVMLPVVDQAEAVRREKLKNKEKLEIKRERKAARTLAIVTGAFIVCWLPFFIIALVRPFFMDAMEVPEVVMSIVLWLGYMNSLLNPVIYTIFSPDFRNAFQKILFGKYRRNKPRKNFY